MNSLVNKVAKNSNALMTFIVTTNCRNNIVVQINVISFSKGSSGRIRRRPLWIGRQDYCGKRKKEILRRTILKEDAQMEIYSKRDKLRILSPGREVENLSKEEAKQVIGKLYRKWNYRYLPKREERRKEAPEEIKSFAELFQTDLDIRETEIDMQARLYFRYWFGWIGSLLYAGIYS